MKFVSSIQRIQHERPGVGWALTLSGAVLPVVASFGIWLLFRAKDFASQVRDDFERSPGFIDYTVFSLALLFFAALFVAGLVLLWARVRRHDST